MCRDSATCESLAVAGEVQTAHDCSLSLNSTGPTPTRTSSLTSARGRRRVRLVASWTGKSPDTTGMRLPRSACHKTDTHDDPRRLVRHAARFSSRGCPVRDASVYTCTVHDKLSSTRLQNYTIDASLMSVSVSVSVPWNSSLRMRACRASRCRGMQP